MGVQGPHLQHARRGVVLGSLEPADESRRDAHTSQHQGQGRSEILAVPSLAIEDKVLDRIERGIIDRKIERVAELIRVAEVRLKHAGGGFAVGISILGRSIENLTGELCQTLRRGVPQPLHPRRKSIQLDGVPSVQTPGGLRDRERTRRDGRHGIEKGAVQFEDFSPRQRLRKRVKVQQIMRSLSGGTLDRPRIKEDERVEGLQADIESDRCIGIAGHIPAVVPIGCLVPASLLVMVQDRPAKQRLSTHRSGEFAGGDRFIGIAVENLDLHDQFVTLHDLTNVAQLHVLRKASGPAWSAQRTVAEDVQGANPDAGSQHEEREAHEEHQNKNQHSAAQVLRGDPATLFIGAESVASQTVAGLCRVRLGHSGVRLRLRGEQSGIGQQGGPREAQQRHRRDGGRRIDEQGHPIPGLVGEHCSEGDLQHGQGEHPPHAPQIFLLPQKRPRQIHHQVPTGQELIQTTLGFVGLAGLEHGVCQRHQPGQIQQQSRWLDPPVPINDHQRQQRQREREQSQWCLFRSCKDRRSEADLQSQADVQRVTKRSHPRFPRE